MRKTPQGGKIGKEDFMRLSEEKIKQAILHPQLEIRQRALRYFSVCHSDDERVVPW